jgi:hypothetical protein
MNFTPSLDLAEYHENALRIIAKFFGDDVAVVAAYPRFLERIPRTAISIELASIFPARPDDMGTEQFHAEVRFAAYVFVSFLEPDPKLLVRQLASRLVACIYGSRFESFVAPANILACDADILRLPGSSKAADDYEVFRIDWSHEAFFNDSVWAFSSNLPLEIWSNQQPITP